MRSYFKLAFLFFRICLGSSNCLSSLHFCRHAQVVHTFIVGLRRIGTEAALRLASDGVAPQSSCFFVFTQVLEAFFFDMIMREYLESLF